MDWYKEILMFIMQLGSLILALIILHKVTKTKVQYNGKGNNN